VKKSSIALASLLLASPLAAGELRGRVLAGDRPAAGVTVSALPYETPRDEALRLARGGAAPRALASAASGADGTFTLPVPHAQGAPEKLFALELTGGGIAPVRVEDVFSSAEAEDAGDVAVLRGEPLAGRVVDSSGAPVGDAETVLTAPAAGDGKPLPVLAKTGADGGFRFDAAAPGSLLAVRKAGRGRARRARSPRASGRPLARPRARGRRREA